jgi:hypothetical protein
MGICLTAIFHVKGNRKDFILCDGECVLKRVSPKLPCTNDLDNLEKFVMDGMNGIV